MPIPRDEEDKILFIDENHDGIPDDQQQPITSEDQIPTPAEAPKSATTATLESLLDENKNEVTRLQQQGNDAAEPLTNRANRLETSERGLERQDNANMFAGVANTISTGLDGATSFKDHKMDNSEARKNNTQLAETVTKEQAARQAISEKLRARAEVERNRGVNARVAGLQTENALNTNTMAVKSAPLDAKLKENSLTTSNNAIEDHKTSVTQQKEMNDANSDISKSAREFVFKAYGENLPATMSAARLEKIYPLLKDKYINDQNNQTKKEVAKQRSEDNRYRNDLLTSQNADRLAAKEKAATDKIGKDVEKATEKHDERVEKSVNHYSETLAKSGVVRADAALAVINKYLNDPKFKNDLPGYGMAAGAMPDGLLSQDAKDLRQAVQTLFNIELKDRSGGAVTPQEQGRLQREFGNGTWTTEASLRKGLQEYSNRLDSTKNNILGGFSPEVREIYEQRNPTMKMEITDNRQGSGSGSSGQAPRRMVKSAELPSRK